MDCYNQTGHFGNIIFPQGIVDELLELYEAGSMLYVLGPEEEEECAGSHALVDEPFSIAVWGHDTIADEKNGLYGGDPWELVIEGDEGLETLELTLEDDGPPKRGEQVYFDNSIYVIDEFAPAGSPAAASFDLLSDEELADFGEGALLSIGVTSPDDVIGFTVEADTNGTVSEVELPQASGEHDHLDWHHIEEGEGEGTLRIVCLFADDPQPAGEVLPITLRIETSDNATFQMVNGSVLRAAEEYPELVPVTIAPTITQIMSVLRGDVNDDGTVDSADLVAVLHHLIYLARLSEGQRAAADLYPFDTGNGKVGVRDAWLLARALCKEEWPDGTSLNHTE